MKASCGTVTNFSSLKGTGPFNLPCTLWRAFKKNMENHGIINHTTKVPLGSGQAQSTDRSAGRPEHDADHGGTTPAITCTKDADSDTQMLHPRPSIEVLRYRYANCTGDKQPIDSRLASKPCDLR
ncbi:hypothetical protein K1T71_008662 [Dendrolimus kikuchii]|uniref:Uncharacterized protein n=1 Tax=Dendrolimus kikuchii TaxID=765133 RepID=A0ACC1CV37_9NEOP|nr:hypothetical protein K1T71_008662 [Dendrolimus kikuchii]